MYQPLGKAKARKMVALMLHKDSAAFKERYDRCLCMLKQWDEAYKSRHELKEPVDANQTHPCDSYDMYVLPTRAKIRIRLCGKLGLWYPSMASKAATYTVLERLALNHD